MTTPKLPEGRDDAPGAAPIAPETARPVAETHDVDVTTLLRDPVTPDPDEEAWLREASSRMRERFREALYGPYADLEEPDTSGVFNLTRRR